MVFLSIAAIIKLYMLDQILRYICLESRSILEYDPNINKDDNRICSRCFKTISNPVNRIVIKQLIVIVVSGAIIDICAWSIKFGSYPCRIITNAVILTTRVAIAEILIVSFDDNPITPEFRDTTCTTECDY